MEPDYTRREAHLAQCFWDSLIGALWTLEHLADGLFFTEALEKTDTRIFQEEQSGI